VDEAIFTMGLPHIDCFGRCLKGDVDEPYLEEATWGVRRQLRDPKTCLIQAIVLAVQKDFIDAVRAGRACLFHLRGLMYTITQRLTWRMATKRALELMRERLGRHGESLEETPSSDFGPEEAILAAENRLIEHATVEIINREVACYSATKIAVFHARTEDPPRSYRDIAAELGLSPGACRKHFCELRARLVRVLKPGS
jgi:DNA-directed RNA polymerase specialized sigma24 family protein